MSDFQLAKHKQNMEKKFQENNLKPGDAGFVYDKRVEFKQGGEKVDDGWDDDDEDYFDDDFA